MPSLPAQLSQHVVPATAEAAAPAYKISPYKWAAGYVGIAEGFICEGNGRIGMGYTQEQAYAQWLKKQPKELDTSIPVVSNYREGLEPPVDI